MLGDREERPSGGIEERGARRRPTTFCTGEAEAEALEKRAEALGRLDRVGQLELVLDKLPAIVAAAAEPLADANVTRVGDSLHPLVKGAGTGLAGTLEIIKSTTGIDVAGTLHAAAGPEAPKDLMTKRRNRMRKTWTTGDDRPT